MENILKYKYNIKELKEDKLWLLYAKTNDPLIKEYFVAKYEKLVYKVVNNIIANKKYTEFLEKDDVISNAFMGLLDAIKKYGKTNKRGKRKAKFITFAYTRIFGSVMDGFRLAGRYFTPLEPGKSIDYTTKDNRVKAPDEIINNNYLKEEIFNILNKCELEENILIRLTLFSSFNEKTISYLMNNTIPGIKKMRLSIYKKLKKLIKDSHYPYIQEVLNEEILINVPQGKNTAQSENL